MQVCGCRHADLSARTVALPAQHQEAVGQGSRASRLHPRAARGSRMWAVHEDRLVLNSLCRCTCPACLPCRGIAALWNHSMCTQDLQTLQAPARCVIMPGRSSRVAATLTSQAGLPVVSHVTDDHLLSFDVTCRAAHMISESISARQLDAPAVLR